MADRDTHLAIWQRVRSHLEGRGLDKAQIARETGFPYPTVNRWWSERHLPDPSGLQSLIVVYGLNGHWVMTGEGSPDAAVQQTVDKADIVGSMAYQAGGRAALAMMAGEIEKAVAVAKKAWSAPAPDPDQLRRVRDAVDVVTEILDKPQTKKGRKAG